MSENIMNAPHGMNLVVETRAGTVYIGRFDESNGFEVLMHDVGLWEPKEGEAPDDWIRETATYGVEVVQRDCRFPASEVTRWRPLGEIQKLG